MLNQRWNFSEEHVQWPSQKMARPLLGNFFSLLPSSSTLKGIWPAWWKTLSVELEQTRSSGPDWNRAVWKPRRLKCPLTPRGGRRVWRSDIQGLCPTLTLLMWLWQMTSCLWATVSSSVNRDSSSDCKRFSEILCWLASELFVLIVVGVNILLNLILRTHQSITEPVTPYYNQIKNQQQSSFIWYHIPYKVNC